MPIYSTWQSRDERTEVSSAEVERREWIKVRLKGKGGIISFEATIAFVVPLIKLALDQADIHSLFVWWISLLSLHILVILVRGRSQGYQMRLTFWNTVGDA